MRPLLGPCWPLLGSYEAPFIIYLPAYLGGNGQPQLYGLGTLHGVPAGRSGLPPPVRLLQFGRRIYLSYTWLAFGRYFILKISVLPWTP